MSSERSSCATLSVHHDIEFYPVRSQGLPLVHNHPANICTCICTYIIRESVLKFDLLHSSGLPLLAVRHESIWWFAACLQGRLTLLRDLPRPRSLYNYMVYDDVHSTYYAYIPTGRNASDGKDACNRRFLCPLLCTYIPKHLYVCVSSLLFLSALTIKSCEELN